MTVSKVENVIVMLLCTRQPLGYVLVRQLLDKQIITRKYRILLLLANGVSCQDILTFTLTISIKIKMRADFPILNPAIVSQSSNLITQSIQLNVTSLLSCSWHEL